MRRIKTHLTALLLCVYSQISYAQIAHFVIRDEFQKYYERFNVNSSFILFDQNKNEYLYCNQSQSNVAFTPASTFKICNALIGLETGVIVDEQYKLFRDSILHQNGLWNSDQDLKTAFANSTVWYFQNVARQIGSIRMKYWLDKLNYGNADTSGGIDKFWLSGGLRITPQQEIDFLRDLYNNRLPFSQRNMDIVKKIMLTEQSNSYKLFSKTGWGTQDSLSIGWNVGFIQTNKNVYFFVNCIQTSDFNHKEFAGARIEIVSEIVNELNLIDKKRLKISHLTGDFYIYTTYRNFKGFRFPSNGLYLVTDSGVIIIDSPWDTTQFQPLLDSIKLKHHKEAILCIATHSHEDRTGGLEFYKTKGIKTYTTQSTDKISKARNEKRAEFIMINDTSFRVGKYNFQTFYPGEGHTPDNIVIWFGKEKILYGGCLVKSFDANDLGFIGDANIEEWPLTIKRIQKKFRNPKYIIPGHQTLSDKNSLLHTLNLIKKNRN